MRHLPGFRPLPAAGAALLLAALLAGCEKPPLPVLEPLPPLRGDSGIAAPRVNGRVGAPERDQSARISLAPAAQLRVPPGRSAGSGGGDVSLDFADTDIREVVAQILGGILHVTYTIDPGVTGTVTLHTAGPIARPQLLPTLQTLLAQVSATLVTAGDVYRVLPATAAVVAPGLAGSVLSPGAALVPLRFASAEELAKTLQPYVANGGKVIAEPGRNALLVTGDPTTRETLVSLVRAFDVDLLAGQSYALFPVKSGDAKDFATGLQDAFRAQSNGPLAGLVRVIPMQRINSVLVVSSQPQLIEDARRVYALIERKQRETVRSWHVYYLQNSRANDVAYVLQQAFTPNAVTAQPSPGPGSTAPGQAGQQTGMNSIGLNGTMGGGLLGGAGGGMGGGIGGGGLGGGLGGGGLGGGGLGQGGLGGGGLGGGGLGGGLGAGGLGQGGLQGGGLGAAAGTAGQANPLLGGLDQSGGQTDPDSMRIIPHPQNNALLVYATQREEDTIEAMLRKVDILPLQVRIDATIAEVDLNDQLQYGTQFFFKQGGLNGALAQALPGASPGFLLAGGTASQIALAALQGVTRVHVLSSPQLLVLDNQPAQLQVGDLVPYLTATSQSTISSNAPVVNSINYMQTGVIMQVTPRVNSGGLVTLDIVQVVSDVDPSVQTSGISSPAFLERSVQSRVVVQDGQTVGLAGLIRDSVTRSNQGVPWLKDIPLLGAVLGQQNNNRSRTELLVLVTPHVIHDQHDARELTEDLREQLINAAMVPAELQRLPPAGSADPNLRLRRRLGLQ